MSRAGKIFKGRHGGFAKFVAGTLSVFVLVMVFWPGNNVIRWIGAKIEIARQERQIRDYRHKIREMNGRIRMLTSDKDTLEKFAREQFNFAEPGDDVYIVE